MVIPNGIGSSQVAGWEPENFKFSDPISLKEIDWTGWNGKISFSFHRLV